MAATLTVDSWALHRLTLDFADQFVPGTLIANAADAKGRGIDLYITDNGEAVSMTNMKVYLLWRHSLGNQGQTQFTAVNAGTGHYKVYYPAGMMVEGIVIARISIYIGSTTPITGSRDFRINVERNPINEGDAMASDDFSAFIQATIDLNELNASITQAEVGRVTAESGRVSAESARVTAEQGRVSAESARVEEFGTMRTQLQQATANATSATATANTAAANANAAAAATANVVAEAVEALSHETGTEAAQINVLAIEVADLKQDYVVVSEALYAPSSKMTISGEAVTPSSATVSGEKVTLS